ncbi:ATP-binding protein [Rhizobiaceae bacterium]|nr:ATP-binding protein [Rhizobiaceae bacterium]
MLARNREAHLLAALPHPVFSLTTDGMFLEGNAATEAFFGSSLPVLRRRRVDDYAGPHSALASLLKQVAADGVAVSAYGIELSAPRLPSVRRVDAYVAPLGEDSEELIVMLQGRGMAEALTERLHHRHAARSVTGLASMLAHEIKNPLAGIRGAAQLLSRAVSDDARNLTTLITDETDRIVRLIDRMEVFSDESPTSRAPVNIHAVLDHVKRLVQSGTESTNVDIEEYYDPSLPPVFANRDQLVQVVLNLVKNALEAATSAGTITLTTAYRPGIRMMRMGQAASVALPISLEVADDGPGVPKEMLEQMFDPFVSSKTNGSGLGLALVAKLVHDHGGTVGHARSGGKTRFTVLLPVLDPTEAPPSESLSDA